MRYHKELGRLIISWDYDLLLARGSAGSAELFFCRQNQSGYPVKSRVAALLLAVEVCPPGFSIVYGPAEALE